MTSPLHIQTATLERRNDICSLLSVLNTDHYTFSNFHNIDTYLSRGECYIATDNNQVVGVIVLRCEEQSCEICLIVSAQKGVGRKLIEFAVEKCNTERISKLWCWSLYHYNVRGFYEKMGFTESFLMKKQWYGEDCYFFGREILL